MSVFYQVSPSGTVLCIFPIPIRPEAPSESESFLGLLSLGFELVLGLLGWSLGIYLKQESAECIYPENIFAICSSLHCSFSEKALRDIRIINKFGLQMLFL